MHNIHGWRWIFLLEGLPIIPLGFITFFFLEHIPDTVQCKFIKEAIVDSSCVIVIEGLDSIEKQILTNMLRDDAGVTNSESELSARLSWRQVRHTFVDWHVYLYVVITVGNLLAFKCFTVYLPTFVKDMGYTEADAQLMSAPPYVAACVCALLGSFSSSKKNEHGYHLSFFMSICVLGFVLLITLTEKGTAAMYAGTCLVCCGAFAAFPILLSWLTKNIGGRTKRAMAIGFALAIEQIGGVVAPQVSNLLKRYPRL